MYMSLKNDLLSDFQQKNCIFLKFDEIIYILYNLRNLRKININYQLTELIKIEKL